jgi:hypothetical protein
MRPVCFLYKTWCGTNQYQARHTLWVTPRCMQSQHGAQRPAAQCVRAVDMFQHLINHCISAYKERALLFDRSRVVLAPARLCQVAPVRQASLSIRQDACPSHATTTVASLLRFNAASRVSTSAMLCAADSVMRRRAVPAGTVGGRMAGTQIPCSAKPAVQCVRWFRFRRSLSLE